MGENDPVAKILREKSVSRDAQKMVGNVEDNTEIWDTLVTCQRQRPEMYTVWPKL